MNATLKVVKMKPENYSLRLELSFNLQCYDLCSASGQKGFIFATALSVFMQDICLS